MSINLNLSPTGRKAGKKKRLNPELGAIHIPLPVIESTAVQSISLTPVRANWRTIRNKTLNTDLSFSDRVSRLAENETMLNHQIMANRNSHAITHALKPTPIVSYCTPSAPCEVGSPFHHERHLIPNGPCLPHESGKPADIRPLYIDFVGVPMGHAHLMATGKALAYREARNSHLASIMARVRVKVARNKPQFSEAYRAYISRHNTDNQASRESDIVRWQAQWPAHKQAGVRIAESQSREKDGARTWFIYDVDTPCLPGNPAITTISVPLGGRGIVTIRDCEPVTEKKAIKGVKKTTYSLAHFDTTKEQLADVESACAEMKQSAHDIFAEAIVKTAPSELTDNYLCVSRNLSDGAIQTHSAPTMKSAEMKARMIHTAHPNTVQTVLSKVQARAMRFDILLSGGSQAE